VAFAGLIRDGRVVVPATATDSAGNTSEFSEAVLVGVPKK
jgi:hypothetical protein